ncbi:hypothetical protein FQN60_016744 [Etheostoma spectabile]|uniref:Palmitoyltransferase n=1 Tax=Etheostoma spectabile TaxID=54343 RepID=A0A5J5CD35_9PERO|nr:hypothetical protein FQN60_000084 [Etheostoma spectabile]KAA8587882.1 hypothetical protein FQN60_016744 [Etheostoma spectabile]
MLRSTASLSVTEEVLAIRHQIIYLPKTPRRPGGNVSWVCRVGETPSLQESSWGNLRLPCPHQATRPGFRAILQALKVYYSFVPYIIISCVILQNICLGAGDIMVLEDEPKKDVAEDEGEIDLEAVKCSSFSPPATVILLILLCFEGLLFLIFTSVMFGTQVHSICTDETGIEQLKKEERRWAKKTKWMNMRAVFGHPFSLLWFSPFSTPDHGKAETYQYVV